jgi:hypothetical protein
MVNGVVQPDMHRVRVRRQMSCPLHRNAKKIAHHNIKGAPMTNALQQRLDEIRSCLGGQMQDLGIEPHAKRIAGVYIVSLTGDGLRVPVQIELTGAALLPSSAPGLTGCSVYFEKWYPVAVGDNGWTYYEFSSSHDLTLKGDIDEALAALSNAVATAGVVRDASVGAKVTSNEAACSMYEELKGLSLIHGEFEISFSNHEGVEAFDFIDAHDRAWKFAFKGGQVRAAIDGKRAGSFHKTDIHGMRNLILEKLVYEAPPAPKW